MTIPNAKKIKSNPALCALHLGWDAFMRLLPLPSKPHILIACMPKSGSTFLATALSEYQGLRRARLVPAWGMREQELSQVRLARHNHQSYVAQHHVKNSEWLQELARRYKLTQVVLVRNLFDVVVSARDHIRREPINHADAYSGSYAGMDDATLEENIVRMGMPWYIQFYLSWRKAPDALIVSYEDMIAHPEDTVARILKHAGIKPDMARVKAALARAKAREVRMNVGVAGRGKNLSPAAAKSLLKLLDIFPQCANDKYFKQMHAFWKKKSGRLTSLVITNLWSFNALLP